jgi:hypothetical protein
MLSFKNIEDSHKEMYLEELSSSGLWVSLSLSIWAVKFQLNFSGISNSRIAAEFELMDSYFGEITKIESIKEELVRLCKKIRLHWKVALDSENGQFEKRQASGQRVNENDYEERKASLKSKIGDFQRLETDLIGLSDEEVSLLTDTLRISKDLRPEIYASPIKSFN